MERLNDGFGDKMATFIQRFSTFLGGYVIGFATGWKLTLVVMAATPILFIVAAVLGRVSFYIWPTYYNSYQFKAVKTTPTKRKR